MLTLEMDQKTIYTIAILLPLLVVTVGLSFAVSVDSYLGERQKWAFVGIILLVIGLMIQNYADLLLSAGEPRVLLRTVVDICGYVIRPVILQLFCCLVEPKRRLRPLWVVVGINAALHLTALFSPLVFYIDGNNHYHGGPLHSACLIVSLLLLARLFCLSVRKFRQTHGREIWIPLFIVPIILLSIWLDGHVGLAELPVSFLTIAIVTACILYYNWLHLQMVRDYVQTIQNRQREQLMLSQIKPHFLYNALGTIEGLCEKDPKAARNAMARFSRYLRSNLTDITENDTIPFEQELSHTQLYLELERLRFGSALEVRWDISCTDFFLPPLTLEPLAENAVTHGVRQKEDGSGAVLISTRERPDCYEITVHDDGPGFDPRVLPADGKPHVGIENVRKRLQSVVGGSLTIHSGMGAGTTATIRVPKRGA